MEIGSRWKEGEERVEVGVERKLAATFYGGRVEGEENFWERGQFLGFWTRLLGWASAVQGPISPPGPFPFVHWGPGPAGTHASQPPPPPPATSPTATRAPTAQVSVSRLAQVARADLLRA